MNAYQLCDHIHYITTKITNLINLNKYDDTIALIKTIRQNHPNIGITDICSNIYKDVDNAKNFVLYALSTKNSEIAALFLHNNNSIGSLSNDAVHYTVLGGTLPCLSMLSDHDISDHDIDMNSTRSAIPSGSESSICELEFKRSDIKKFLLEQGIENYETTGLMLATQNGVLEIVKFLINKDAADIHNFDFSTSRETTPLLRATAKGDERVVKCLLQFGQDVHEKNAFGYTNLMCAVIGGHARIAKLFLDIGVNVEDRFLSKCEDHLNRSTNRYLEVEGWTALMFAVDHNNMEMLQLLVQHSANVNVIARNGINPLILAATKGHFEVVKFLADSCADLHYSPEGGCSALCAAATQGHFNIARFLVSHGAKLSIEDENFIADTQEIKFLRELENEHAKNHTVIDPSSTIADPHTAPLCGESASSSRCSFSQ